MNMRHAYSSPGFSRHGRTRRSGMLLLVVGVHIGVAALIMMAKTVAPLIQESPLFVDFITPEAPKVSAPRPLPLVKPQPVVKRSTPVKLEATRSEVVTESAPMAPPENVPPAPHAPAATAPVVTEARFDAAYLRNPAPPYPPVSRRMGEEGKVLLRVLVSPQGTAESVEVKETSSSYRLDESAKRTVRTWKFIPAKRGDVPVQSRVLVPIIFKLEQ